MHKLVARITVSSALIGSCFATHAAAGDPPVPLTECQTRVQGTSYILTGDLDCPDAWAGVTLDSNATVNLNGFTLRTPKGVGVNCLRQCTVLGPGRIEALGGVYTARRTVVSGVTFVGTPLPDGWIGIGIHAGKLLVDNTTVENFDIGLTAIHATIESSSITGNHSAGMEVGFHPWATPSGTPCGGGKVRITNSDVTGNTVDPRDGYCAGTYPCADIVSCKRPRLDELTTCETSVLYQGSQTWDVCSLD